MKVEDNYYIQDGGMGGNSWMFHFYPHNDGIVLLYYSSQSNYTDDPAIEAYLISEDDYKEIIKNCDDKFLKNIDLSDVINNEASKYLYGASADFDEIIKYIFHNKETMAIANEWWKRKPEFYGDNGHFSIETIIADRLQEKIEDVEEWENLLNGYEKNGMLFTDMLKEMKPYGIFHKDWEKDKERIDR